MMKFEELKNYYEYEIVDEEQFEKIEEHEEVIKVVCNGISGVDSNNIYYTAYSENDEFDFYTELKR